MSRIINELRFWSVVWLMFLAVAVVVACGYLIGKQGQSRFADMIDRLSRRLEREPE